MVVGILIDHFGWFGVPANPISITRTTGTIIMILAVSLVQPKKKRDLTTDLEEEKRIVKLFG